MDSLEDIVEWGHPNPVFPKKKNQYVIVLIKRNTKKPTCSTSRAIAAVVMGLDILAIRKGVSGVIGTVFSTSRDRYIECMDI